MSVPTLRWLQIHRYEQFDPVRIEFSEHENLILGVNGAGKTRLLKLLRAVLSLDFGELRGQSFDVEFELVTWTAIDASHPLTIRGRVQDEVVVRGDNPGDRPGLMPRQGISLAAMLMFESQGTTLRCELKNGEMTFRESNGAFEEVVSYLGDGLLLPTFRYSDTSVAARTVLAMYPTCESVFVREADQEFQILTHEIEYSAEITGGRNRRLAKIFSPERLERFLEHDLFPLILQVLVVVNWNTGSTEAERHLFESSLEPRAGVLQQDEIMKRICGAIRARHVRYLPHVVREKGEIVECRGLGLRVCFLDGTELADTELTFGQRRFLYAGLMLLTHPLAPFLMDEVDNGLHPRLIETLLDLLVGRQLFLASHNKLIIDYTNFAGPEDVQKKIHVVERGDDGRQTVRTFDEETARTVYEKISVAIQSPSEVLLAEGLW